MGKIDDQNGRVILTSGRSLMALVTAHSLGKRGIEVIGAECVELTVLTFSKYVEKNEIYTSYLEDEEKFMDDLEEIIRKHKPNDDRPYVLMPIFKEIRIIARHRERFESLITVACPDIKSIDRIFPKQKLAQTAIEQEVNIPRTFFPEKEEELEDIAEKLGYPLLIKPYDASGGRGIRKAANLQEMKDAFQENLELFDQTPLVQELADGKDYCLTGIWQNGELKASMAYRNLQHLPSESGAGAGAMRETVDDQPFIETAGKLLGPLNWNGIAEVDFLWNEDPDELPYLIEVNPRFWAGLFQSVQSGIDYPWLNFSLFAHDKLPDSEAPVLGTKTKLPLAWLYSAVKESLDFDEFFGGLESAGKRSLVALKSGRVGEAFNIFTDALRKGIGELDNFENLSSVLREAESAENEFFNEEDPSASLGVLYVISYLIRYQKLPPELGS